LYGSNKAAILMEFTKDVLRNNEYKLMCDFVNPEFVFYRPAEFIDKRLVKFSQCDINIFNILYRIYKRISKQSIKIEKE
jgi:hypothetical protein